MTAPSPVRLGGYPTKKCPRVTHNENSQFSPPKPEVSANLQQLFDEGREFEDRVTDALLVAHPEACFIDEPHLGWETSVKTTLEAMERGEPLIINGRLPDVDGRVGAPDVLVRVGPKDSGGYRPIDIKHHHTFGKQKRAVLTYAPLAGPADRLEDESRSGNGLHRSDDTLQLAHYVRMLEGLGFGVGTLLNRPGGGHWGGIIGTSDFTELTGARLGITWYDLDAPHETTYSASAPNHRKKRSAMERYDHEFAFRLEVARVAQGGRELVLPIGTKECFDCVWQDYCAEVAGPDDPSFAFTTGHLDAREWLFLRKYGGDTVAGLAALDPAALLPDFKKQAVRPGAQTRLEGAVERARMLRDDVDLEPLGEWPEVPAADLEIDLDIEWDPAGHIYQWGLRVRSGQDEETASYQPVVSFEEIDEQAEAVLADEFADRLELLLKEAEGSVAIYHWSGVEVSRTLRFPRVAALLEGRTVDLMAWLKQHFRLLGAFSIKDVAPLFDFSWGVDEAGGFASMRMIESARWGHEDARRWCLEYNESDVAAQAAIRDGLRERRAAALE